MGILVLGLIIFLGIHSLSIVNEPLRNRMVQSMGEGAFKGIYSVIALVGLVLIFWGYGAARLDPVLLYSPPAWLRHLAMLLLVPVFPLLFAAYFPGRISRTLKHPMLVAVKLWAVAHLLANGMAHDVLLFGAFLAWAVVDRISLKRRTARDIPTLPAQPFNDLIALVGGLAVYVLFVVWAHQWLIGVAPV
ncbi:NnrU family protein [Marinobacter segnicrescens]|uniref:NnrU family protein n=1 Tax=Marinobacter segnicrescens TaxID=430453 RepID=UPI003A944464